MKKNIRYLFFVLTAMSIVLLSCKKDDPIDEREAVVGSYNITETWSWSGSTYTSDGNLSYNMTATKSSQSEVKILITNLRNRNYTFEADLNGINFQILSQAQIIDGVTVTFSGSGKFTATTLTFNYTATNYPMYDGDVQIKGTLTSSVIGTKL